MPQPVRSTTQIWEVSRHEYGISVLVPQTSFGGETSVGVAKCQLFSLANLFKDQLSNTNVSCLSNWTVRMHLKDFFSPLPKKLLEFLVFPFKKA